MKLLRNVICCVTVIFISVVSNAQLYKIDLNNKIDKASLIVEGKVIAQHSFWNDAHTVIYTSNTIHVYRLFKGHIFSKEIEVLTQGGTVGDKCLKVSDVLNLDNNQKGMFFLLENALKLRSPITKNILFDVYSSGQGFLRYDETTKTAFAPFVKYDIENTLYNLVQQRTGFKAITIDSDETGSSSKNNSGGVISNGTAGAVITSYFPATVQAGTINDAKNNILTIKGSGFGDDPLNTAGVSFKDANNDNTNPDYKVQFNSPYILSWTDTQIVLNVPDRAATGKFKVTAANGTSAVSATNLNVFFAVLNAEFTAGGKDYIREPRLMNTNGSGGYTIQFSTNTAGGGVNFTTSPAKGTFERALATWREIVGANLTEGSPTNSQKVDDDGVNIVLFDNNNTGVPKMADGVLESTYSWFSACTQGAQVLTAQKTGFDIIIRNNGVSLGSSISFEYGPCFPAVGTYDLEMIILHEIGHALNLSHINDDYENGGAGYQTINPSKVMHYSILDYVDRRSPDASAYQGALYTTTPQGNSYGNCGLFSGEMSPLQALNIPNDECPSTFPSTEIQPNTKVVFDLVHATSNKFVDPSFEQVNCKSSGTSVTNNAYYAFSTGTNPSVVLTIADYVTSPNELADCAAQSVRMALYDVQSCPQGQSYPQPVICSNFNANGTINLNGLQQNHKYLLYFDGVRNTKAFFNIIFNSDSSIANPGTAVTVMVGPNPVVNNQDLNVYISNITSTGMSYQYILYDAVGRRLTTGKVSATPPTITFKIDTRTIAPGIYFLKVIDENNKVISTTRIFRP
ncbi:MAG: T9SS type A sorting domain-containing protein [Parafilimonas sp.]|nr:T9SS type A sorting domain-containing protein [Parafilimonas sp.]